MRSHPALAFVWILSIIVLTVISLFLTVSYQNIIETGGYLADAYESWGTSHYVLMHLPHFIAGFGILGGLILFIIIPPVSNTK